MFKKILIPTDGADLCAIKLAEAAAPLAKRFGAQIHVIHVVEAPRYIEPYGDFMVYTTIMDQLEDIGRDAVMLVVEKLNELGVKDVKVKITEGYPADEILQYANKHTMELILIGTHGRRGLGRLLLGSVAEEVLRRSPVPVITIPVPAHT